MKKIIVANWKMNGSFEQASQWVDSFKENYKNIKDAIEDYVDVVVCPPSCFLDYIDNNLLDDAIDRLEKIGTEQGKKIDDFSQEELSNIAVGQRPFWLGAQDCHFEESGAFTGKISAKMIKDAGVDYVILGHSECRNDEAESDEIVAKKVKTALKNDLIPIICVGESKEIRDQKKHIEFVYKQLLFSIPKDVKFFRLIVAYEPIWSIGTGVVPSKEQIAEMIKLIKRILFEKGAEFAEEIFVLYGGSVNEENAAEILSIEAVDGLLVGKASLDADIFTEICLS